MNDIWLHGTQENLKSLQEHSTNNSDYCNAGLGLFLTKNIEVANSYASANGYIIQLEVDMSKCYRCNEEEFWCMKEPFNHEADLDPMGNWIHLPGSKSKDKFLKHGYTTLLYNDNEMGEVLVLLDYKAAKIIKSIKINEKVEIVTKMNKKW